MSADPGIGASGEGICLGCGAVVAEVTASGACQECGHPLMKREARFRLGLARLDSEPETDPAPMPPEVEEAAREPENSFAAKYILVRKIGGGGMGWVWKAWEIPLARFVAIKFLKAPSGEDVLRFEREAKLAAALSHPNIVPVYEFGRSKGEYYLVMKFIDGPSLDAARLEGPELLRVMIPVCLAVHHAHEAGVIHRDLKPQNIMLMADGWPYVLDFGLAKNVEGGTELSQSGMAVGTPPYMSPEQAQGRRDRVDRRSDVYALGATLYTLVTGCPPFEGSTPMDVLMKVLKEEVVPPRRVKADVPAPLEAIILKALEKDPARRYSSAEGLADDLRRVSSGETILARPPRRRFVPRIVRQNPGVSASLGVAAVAVAAALYFFAARPVATEPAPPPDRVGAARQKWLDQFRSARTAFTFAEFEDGNLSRRAAIESLMNRAPAVLGTDTAEVVQWYGDQAQLGEGEVKVWEAERRPPVRLGQRARAETLAGWARVMGSFLDGLPGEFVPVRQTFSALAGRGAQIAGFRGLVTLRIHVFPYAEVRSMRAGRRWFIKDGKVEDESRGTPSDKDLTTPLVIRDLEIDDYEVELLNPELGARTASLPKDQMEHGKEYWLRGTMAAGGALGLRPER